MIGSRIKKLRIDLGETQEWLATRTGTTRQTIHRYETGEITNIPSDRIELIAEALKTTPAYLMGWESKEPENKYGDHQANLDYFADKPEVLEMYKEIYENENLVLLFDTARELKPKELEKVLKYMKLVMEEEL